MSQATSLIEGGTAFAALAIRQCRRRLSPRHEGEDKAVIVTRREDEPAAPVEAVAA
jgi:hypothetical protein